MEVNVLPMGVFNTRQNFDLKSKNLADNVFSNCFFEVYPSAQTDTQKIYCVKRPGVGPIIYTGPSYDIDVGAGCFSAQPYNSTNIYFACTLTPSTDVAVWNWDGTTTRPIANSKVPTYKRINFVNIGLPDDTYTVGWTAQNTLYMYKDFTAASGPITPVATATDLTRPVYLNNRVFVGVRTGTAGTNGRIYQSNLGTYTTFSTSEFLTAESYGGNLVDLARYNNYIVAFKEYSTEFFEDVANQNGTVLGRVGHYTQQVGCQHPNTIVDTGAGELLWLATDESGNRSVKKLSNSFECESIEDEFVSKYLNLTWAYDGSYAFMLNCNNKQFYVLTLKQVYVDGSNTTDSTNVTFVYDMESKLWTHWYSYGQNTSWSDSLGSHNTLGRWKYTGACKDRYNNTYVQDYETGKLHQIDDNFHQDIGGDNEPIPFSIKIANLDFNTYKRKFFNRITVFMDFFQETVKPVIDLYLLRQDTTVTTYRTLSTNPYTVYALGSAKQVGIKINSISNNPIRISAINVDFDVGEGHGIS